MELNLSVVATSGGALNRLNAILWLLAVVHKDDQCSFAMHLSTANRWWCLLTSPFILWYLAAVSNGTDGAPATKLWATVFERSVGVQRHVASMDGTGSSGMAMVVVQAVWRMLGQRQYASAMALM